MKQETIETKLNELSFSELQSIKKLNKSDLKRLVNKCDNETDKDGLISELAFKNGLINDAISIKLDSFFS